MKKLIKILILVCCFNGILNAQNKSETVLFDSDRYQLTTEAKSKLDAVVSNLDLEQLKSVGLYGNTDADGDSKYNIELSKNRTKTVSDYLTSKGIPSDKISQNFNGENKPVAQNSIESGKQQNRRVELVFEFEGKEVVNTIFKKMETETQNFEGKSNQDIEITGKYGTKIKIPKNALMKSNDKYAVGKIKLELKEFYKKSDMIGANLHTMSDKNILETGGMIYIEATNNGEKLQLKKNAKITIEMASKNNQSDMQVFYGHPKNKGINWDTNEDEPLAVEEDYGTGERYTIWKSTINGVVVKTDTLRDGEGGSNFKRDSLTNKKLTTIEKTILQSGKLGWINCDRFYEVKNKTDLIVNIDLKYKPEIRLVFKDINSIMSAYLDKNNNFVFEDIPSGRKATLVAFSSIEDETYLAMKDVVITKDNPVGLELQKTTLQDLKTQLLQLD